VVRRRVERNVRGGAANATLRRRAALVKWRHATIRRRCFAPCLSCRLSSGGVCVCELSFYAFVVAYINVGITRIDLIRGLTDAHA
jgi:hypothetical protein